MTPQPPVDPLRELRENYRSGAPYQPPVDPLRENYLPPASVARLFSVNIKTVGRWAADGKIASIRTPGGHRRYSETSVRALLQQQGGGR